MSLEHRLPPVRPPGEAPSVSLLPRAASRLAADDQSVVSPIGEWSAHTTGGTVATRSLLSVSHNLDARADGAFQRAQPIQTGFDVLDQWIGNGLRQGELFLIGGAAGIGKTTFCLQMARNMAASGSANVLYACYEHPTEYVLNRLLVQETIDPEASNPSGLTLDELQALIVDSLRADPGNGLYEALASHPAGTRAAAGINQYGGRFHLVADAARENGIATLQALVAEHRARDEQPFVLFVDYLQKVEPIHGDFSDEAEKVTEVVQALKQLALEHNIAVVAIAAADKDGLRAPRLRLNHLRGSSALMYEADVAIILNEKWKLIDRDHIVFNQHKAQQFRDWVVCTIEKNRAGRSLVEIEFMKRFEYCCFNPRGGKVIERLYEERIHGET